MSDDKEQTSGSAEPQRPHDERWPAGTELGPISRAALQRIRERVRELPYRRRPSGDPESRCAS